MKVYIGKYQDRLTCNIHTRYMEKKYGGEDWPSPFEYNFIEKLLEEVEDKVQIAYNVLNELWFDRQDQKVKVKLDPWDTWSMDNTLAHIIHPMLLQLKETKHGAPVVDNEDVPKELRVTKAQLNKYNKLGEPDPKFFDRWDYVLDEMIWAFENHLNDDTDNEFYSETDNPELKGTFGEFALKVDEEGLRKFNERKANGFRLFGKYYLSLWD